MSVGNFDFDVAVVGASLAGTSTALALARRGHSVLLVEAAQFPRAKACGEGLSCMGASALASLGMPLSQLGVEFAPYYGFRFLRGRHQTELRYAEPHGYGIARFSLDAAVLRGTQKYKSLIKVVEGHSPHIEREFGGFRLDSLRVRYLVLATGARSNLPESLGVPIQHTPGINRFGFALTVHAPQLQHELAPLVHVFIEKGYQVCLTPTAPQSLNFSFLVTKQPDTISMRNSEAHALVGRLAKRLKLSIVPSAAREQPVLGASNIGALSREAYFQDIFVVGDAWRQLDPIGGMGMTQALLSGMITGASIAELFASKKENVEAVLSQHQKTLHRAHRRLKLVTSLSYFSMHYAPIPHRVCASALARKVLGSVHKPSEEVSPSAERIISEF